MTKQEITNKLKIEKEKYEKTYKEACQKEKEKYEKLKDKIVEYICAQMKIEKFTYANLYCILTGEDYVLRMKTKGCHFFNVYFNLAQKEISFGWFSSNYNSSKEKLPGNAEYLQYLIFIGKFAEIVSNESVINNIFKIFNSINYFSESKFIRGNWEQTKKKLTGLIEDIEKKEFEDKIKDGEHFMYEKSIYKIIKINQSTIRVVKFHCSGIGKPFRLDKSKLNKDNTHFVTVSQVNQLAVS